MPDLFFDASGAFTGILESGVNASLHTAAAKGLAKAALGTAKSITSKLGAVGLGLTAFEIYNEFVNDKFNTHSIVNGVVAVAGFGLGVTAVVIGAPVLATGAAIGGVVYGIAAFSGLDDYIDNATGNWGSGIYNLIK